MRMDEDVNVNVNVDVDVDVDGCGWMNDEWMLFVLYCTVDCD